MQTVKAYEYKDLEQKFAGRVYDEFLNEQVEAELRVLQEDCDAGLITEDEMYKTIGCSKSYAESTAWFVPSCYYEHNKAQVDANVEVTLSKALFTQQGTFVGYKEE